MNERTEDIIARSNLYGLLAFGFGHPEADQHAQIVEGRFQQDVVHCISRCMPMAEIDVGAIADDLRAVSSELGDFEAEYLNSFQTNLPTPSVSLYEGGYTRNSAKATILLELKAFYKNFGLTVSENSHELEDNLTGELEFMHFLAAKEAQALIEGLNVEPYVLAQYDFLSRHLAVWIPKFRKDVATKSVIDFYRTLAEITDLFIGYDAERLSHVHPSRPSPNH